jgi:hypothetical protein
VGVVVTVAAVDQGVMGEVVVMVIGFEGVVYSPGMEVCACSLGVTVMLEASFERWLREDMSSEQLDEKMVPLLGILKQAILAGRESELQVHDMNMSWCNQAGYLLILRMDENDGIAVENNRCMIVCFFSFLLPSFEFLLEVILQHCELVAKHLPTTPAFEVLPKVCILKALDFPLIILS